MSVKSSEKQDDLSGIVMCDTVPSLWQAGALKVHSVFHHACNLTTPDHHLVTLLTRDAPLAPGAARVNRDDFRSLFSVGETLQPRSEGVFATPGVRVALADTRCQSTRVPASAALPANLLTALDAFLPVTAPDYGIWNTLHSSDPRLLQAVRQLAAWLEGASPDAGEYLRALIGAGAGLTPSGDDFLLGALWVMTVMRHPRLPALATAITAHLERTTDISRAMLRYGCEGHFGEQLLALTMPTPLSLNLRLAGIANYGHSSGHDMLTGMFFTLRALSGQRL